MKKRLIDCINELVCSMDEDRRIIILYKDSMVSNNVRLILQRYYKVPDFDPLQDHILVRHMWIITCSLEINNDHPSSNIPYKPSYAELYLTEWEEVI